ncbi:MAG TPA: hypothetical protein VK327_11100 [Candidatus Paceibacterota bacterium]|nr:hypothetical protein [Candidatus Paceibacterota bacterium]
MHDTAPATMKPIGYIVPAICVLTAAGLAFCLALEHQSSAKLNQENNALRQQLSQMDMLLAENQRWSNLLPPTSVLPAPLNDSIAAPRARPEEPARELERLRREAEVLRQQSQQIESLRADTRQVRADQQATRTTPNQRRASPADTTGNGLEILRADYGTDHTNMDVAAELNQRIRGDKLKAIASNNIKGDPEFGQVKHLTVVYRVGGVIRTNAFREGDIVILPNE